MRKNASTSPTYGTWIRTRAVVVFGALTAASLALALLAFATPWALLLLIPCGAFGWIFLILALARYRLSDSGGRYQARIHDLIRSRAAGDRILDIGCGNGHLAIQLAKESPNRRLVGIDFWGSAWEYSKQACERNARLEGVEDRVIFVKGSAASLPFLDAEFDCVVSCLAFHEVRDLTDKTEALPEALRVLRPGGTFALLDLFSAPGPFPQERFVRQRLDAAGAVSVSDAPLSSLMTLPFPLNGKRFLKHARLVSGEKRVSDHVGRTGVGP